MRVLLFLIAAAFTASCASVPGLSLLAAEEDPSPPAPDGLAAGDIDGDGAFPTAALGPAAWDGSQFADVPLPRDFRIVFDQSFTHSGRSGLRIAELRYVGEARPEEVVRYFQTEMPNHGWEFGRLCGVESKMLVYEKGEENLEVMVGDGGAGRTMVAIRLFPR